MLYYVMLIVISSSSSSSSFIFLYLNLCMLCFVCYVFLKEDKTVVQTYIETTLTNNEIMAYYITGYVEGEGCFSLGVHKNKRYTANYQFMPSFTIQVHIIDLPLIKKIKSTFQCGKIYYNKRDNTVNYKVYKLNDIRTKIIPFFNKYQFQGNKKKSFDIFKEVIRLIVENKTKTEEQISYIFYLKEKMNHREIFDE